MTQSRIYNKKKIYIFIKIHLEKMIDIINF